MWKKVPSYSGYLVNENGEVLNTTTCRKLKLQEKRGYKFVSVRIKTDSGSKTKFVGVHRMVCEAFHGECPFDGWHVDHINGNKGDNRPSNLEWVSPSTNIRRGKSRRVRGTKTDGSFVEFSHLAMAEDFGLNTNAIRKSLARKKSNFSQGYFWEYITA